MLEKTDLAERIAALSPVQRKLLEELRRERREPLRPGSFALISEADRALVPAGVVDAYPLTQLQAGMLFHMEEIPDYPLYQNVDSMRLRGRFVPRLFRAVVADAVARHPVLRTSFDLATFSQPLQLVWSQAELAIGVIDLGHLSGAEAEPAIAELIERERRRRFDLERPTLLRFHVHLLTGGEFQFTLTEFHPILDGWSLQSLFVEILNDYFARLRGERPLSPTPLTATFRDSVALERQVLESKDARAYWERTLAGSSVAQLPRWPERYRIASERPVLARTFALPAELLDGSRALARELKVPLKSVFLSAHAHVLSLLAGADDVVTGLTTEVRPEGADGDRVLGLFLNTLPLRIALPRGSWAELVRRVFAAEQELVPFRRYPYAAIQRNRGRGHLFEVVFNLTRFHVYQGVSELADALVADGMAVQLEESHYPLTSTFTLDPHGRAAALLLEYRPEALTPSQVLQIAALYARVLDAIVTRPRSPRDAGAALGAADRHRALVEWNDSRNTLADGCLHELFAQRARRSPNDVAIESGAERLTFGELDGRVRSWAAALRGLGVGPDVPVGLCLERSIDFVAAMLAVLAAGGAYVPLDPGYPRERLARVLADCRPHLVLTRRALVDRLPPDLASVLALEDQAWNEVAAAALESAASPDQLAYVIYTSGSTGQPKGVMVSHAAIRNRLLWMLARHPFEPSDRVLQKTSTSFDASIWEIFCPLLSGARLVLAEPGEEQDASRLLRRALAAEITILQVVPSMLSLLVEEEVDLSRSRLRLLFSGGEALPTRLRERASERFGVPVVNLYGPTEAAIDAASWPGADPGSPAVPLGRPIANTSLFVVDQEQDPVFPGTLGELTIAGAGLARGYFGRPDLTAAAFVPDPWSGRPGARRYRTGDLARHLPDGLLEFAGRLDDQVKVHGFRIEPEEIASVLRRHEALRDAVVVARRDGGREARLVAYVVPKDEDRSPSVTSLRRALEEALPAHLIPSAFVVLRDIPRQPNGKLDRGALPEPGAARPELDAGYIPPRDDRERALAAIWARVLGVERVGVDDDFFALGGDSILSHQIATRARQAGLRMTPQLVFRHPTVATLAREIAALAPLAAERVGGAGEIPLTPIQARFFASQPVDPHHFNQALLLATREPIDPRRLAVALALVVEHHEALAARFHHGEPWRMEIPERRASIGLLARFDLAALGRDAEGGEIERIAARAQRGFDLATGPLFRALLFAPATTGSGRLLLLAHHLVVDGVSWRILLDDLETAYAQGAAAALPERTTSFREWARALAERARGNEALRELDFWLEPARAEVAPVPVDFTAGADLVSATRSVSLSLEPDETRALLQDVPRAYRTEINDALLAALGRALAHWLRAERVLVDVEGHGREELVAGLDPSRTVGWFTSIFPVLLDLGADPFDADPGHLLRSVKEQLRALPSRGAGYGSLRYLAGPEVAAQLAAMPRAEVLFNYLGQLDQALDVDSMFQPAPESTGPSRSPHARREYLLEVEAQVLGGRLEVTWVYGAGRHRRETVAGLAVSFLVALRAIIKHCRHAREGRTPADFPLAAIDQRTLDVILRGRADVEDLLPLTPLQEGLLFHALHEPGAGLYVIQYHVPLRGPLDPTALRRAWERVVGRHPILRTGFLWERLERPLAVVAARVDLPWREEDWRDLPERLAGERLATFLATDRREDFDLRHAPLLRFHLIRTGDRAWELVWTLHHLLLDGWSAPLVHREVMTCYEAIASGREPELSESRPFRDYVAWLAEQDHAAAEAAWREALAGFTTPTTLDLPPPAMPAAGEFGEEIAHLTRAETHALRAFARDHRLTLGTLLAGAWAHLLARYAGRRDVVFGSTVSGRPADLDGVESMVGLFINTVPLRARLEPGATLLGWLAGLQAAQLELRRHEFIPLVRVRALCEVQKAQPLFETLFVFENFPAPALPSALAGRGDRVEIADFRIEERAHYPFTLKSSPDDELPLHGLYDRARFDREQARRMLDFLVSTLRAFAAASPGLRLGDLPPLAPAERLELLIEANREAALATAPGATVHAVFAARAGETPDAVALVQGDLEITYAELDRRANRTARHLRSLGVDRGSIVGVFLERSPDLVVALLAILKAGGAYLPLDVRSPGERLTAILGDARPRFVLSRSDLRSLWPALEPIRLVDLATSDQPSGASPNEPSPADDLPLPEIAGEDDLATLVYTSGSTGVPKGAEIPHRSFMGFMFGTSYARYDRRLVVLQHSSLSWDALTLELWPPLLHGGRSVLFDAPDVEPRTVGLALVRYGVTTAWLTSSFFNLMIEIEPRGLAGLEQLLIGGEAVSVPHVRRALDLLPHLAIVNGYGPSECTVFACCHPIARPLAPSARAISIGRPIGDRRVYLLDGDGQPVPCGVPGEISIAGPALARGYLGLPGLTAERFVPDGVSGEPGARLYRTGDLARFQPGGEIDFLGRFDHQIKIRGFRVEIEEIEAALRRHPEVEAAAVVLRDEPPTGKRLIGFLVPRPGTAPRPDEVRAWLAARLPDYMIPKALLPLAELPLTPNGKLDRRFLTAQAWYVAAPTAEARAPRGLTEEILARIWSEVLGVAQIGSEDDFFELGGHSLLATRVAARLRQAFGIDLPLRRIFDEPTLSGLARAVAAARGALATERLPPLVAQGRAAESPLSFAQERLWFLEQLEPGTPRYNVATALRLDGVLSVPALARALADVADRHEVLRASFATPRGVPVQRLAPAALRTLPEVDLRALPAPAAERQLGELAAAAATLPFDLGAGPLVRVQLVRLGPALQAVLVQMHHAICDGWSLGVFARELCDGYEAAIARRTLDRPALPIQYSDFARWQRSWLTGDLLAAELEHWRGRLGDVALVLDLPTDRPRPARRSIDGASEPLALPPPLADGLGAAARRLGATPFMALLAVFQALLARTCGQDRFTLGMPIAGRHRLETEDLIGLFVNTLVLRCDVAGAPSFEELTARARESTLDAHDHQDLPFERLVEDLAPDRQQSHHPLFQVMFVLQNLPPTALGGADLALSEIQLADVAAKFDLTLEMHEEATGLGASLQYATDLFDATTIRRLLEHFAVLLEGCLADPGRAVGELSILTAAEVEQLERWSGTSEPLPNELCAHRLIEAQADRTPDAPALQAAERTLTYRQLDEASNRLAHALARLDLPPESKVALCLERTPDAIVGLLAIWKAGLVYLPLDPAYPEDRLAYMLGDARARVLLTRSDLVDRIPSFPGRLYCIDDRAAEIASAPAARPAQPVDPDQLAYVIYTSGSTGQAKGAQITHRGVSALTAPGVRSFECGPGSRFLQVSSLNFDASLLEILIALQSGACLVFGDPGVVLLGSDLLALLVDRGITHAIITPSAISSLPEAELPELRTLVSAGEACPPELPRRWAAGRLFLNAYGPTEASIWAAIGPCAPDEVRPTIGRPIANARIHLLDGSLASVPPGGAGELCIGGIGVGRGYLGRPDLTAQMFVPDPFGDPGQRLYRTGDLAAWTADGRIDYRGRIDHQIKIRGFRIEPGEIESALRAHPAVADAVVVAREDGSGTRQLVAYAAAPGAVAVTPAELRGFLRRSLPAHMVPSQFVVLSALPLNRSGKVDRGALPPPSPSSGEEAQGFAPPRTPFEELVAGLWSEILEVERVDRQVGFFEIGGHSLLAAYLTTKLRDTLGVDISVAEFFEEPTVAALARQVESRLAGPALPPAPPILKVSRRRPLPLSPAQQRLWFLDSLEPGSSAYNMPVAFHVSGPLDAPALTGALGEVIARHEILRSRIDARDGEPLQVPEPPGPIPGSLVDLSALRADLRDPLRASLAAAEGARPFSLSRAPMLRALLLRLAPDEHTICLTLHHIAGDAASLRILLRDLSALYAARITGGSSRLPELPLQYADFAVWHRSWLDGDVSEQLSTWWRERLDGMPESLDLPCDRPHAAGRKGPGASVSRPLPSGLDRELRRLGQKEGATRFMTCLAALQAVLLRSAGQDDFGIGTPSAGRDRVEVENLIGFFVNTLVLRGRPSLRQSLRDLLHAAREEALGAYAHAELPFERLVERLGVERRPGRTPLFDVLLVVEEGPALAPDLPGLEARPLDAPSIDAKFDLLAAIGDDDATLTFDSRRFDASSADRLLEQWLRVLAALAESPTTEVGAVDVLGAEARRQVIATWNATATEFPGVADLHALLDGTARRRARAIAVADESRALTYSGLHREAERLASHLRRLGIGPEHRVGLCLERSCEMVVGLLGIVKARGAFVPLDPELPSRRLATLVSSAGLSAVVTLGRYLPLLGDPSVPTVCLDDDAVARRAGRDLRPVPGPAAGAGLAYVIYTSGSTGEPKGCMNTWAGLANRLLWMQREVRLVPSDRILQKTPFSFDVSVWEFFLPLLVGARLVMARPGGHRDTAYLAARIASERITVLHFVPSMLTAFLEDPAAANCSSVRAVIASGEALPMATVRTAAAVLPRAAVHNLYGPTEAAIDVTAWSCDPADPAAVAPIGKPIANLRIYPVDPDLRLVAPGSRGELCLAGVGVGRGYLGRPDLTAERFVPDPFADDPGERMYRTGDLVRFRAGGDAEFLGRLDHQVKIRGLRIELGEIEAALRERPEVVDAVVQAVGDGSDRRLVAWVVPSLPTLPADLASRLGERLPEFMLPAQIVTVDSLPRLTSGKVDRRALPAPERPARASVRGPRDGLEIQLVHLWEELLGVAPIGIDDDFFTLGGHSLLATRLMARLRSRLGRDAPLAALFRAPTIERLAATLRQQDPAQNQPSPLVAIRPEGAEPPLFLVHPIGGDVLCYLDLVRRLPAGRPIYAFAAPGLAEGATYASLAERARAYLEAAQALSPPSEWIVGGWSYGGAVAFEMARQLEQTRAVAPTVVLIDTPAPRRLSALMAIEDELGIDDATRLVLDAKERARQDDRELALDWAELGALDGAARMDLVLERLRRSGLVPPEVGRDDAVRYLRALDARREEIRFAPPGRSSARVVLLRAAERSSTFAATDERTAPLRCAEDELFRDPTLGWQELSSRPVEVHTVSGDHHTMVREPHVGALARRLEACLRGEP